MADCLYHLDLGDLLNRAAKIKLTSGGLISCVLTAAIWQNIRPSLMVASNHLMALLFGACLTAFVGADYRCRRASTRESPDQVSPISRSTRLVFIWLYLLFGANGLAALLSNESFESASEKLRGFLIAGIAVLVLIRLSALVRVPRINGPLSSAALSLEETAEPFLSGEALPEVAGGTLTPAELTGDV